MNTSGFYPIVLVDKIREYDSVYTLKFTSSDPIPFVPGQYVHVLAPSSPPGRENVRHFSIASIPEEGPLRFTVDLAPTSEYKSKLAALELGGLAHLFKVKGEFVLGQPLPNQAIFLAGGLGITPVRSLIRQIVEERLAVDWRLVHVARGPFLYQNEIEAWGGEQARIRRGELESLISQWVSERPAARYYVSGSARFVEGVAALLRVLQVADEAVRVENFH
jgi:ferredoxin-NADP reductase